MSLIDLIADEFVGSPTPSGNNVRNATDVIDGIVNSMSAFWSISIVGLGSNAYFDLSSSFGWALVCVGKNLMIL